MKRIKDPSKLADCVFLFSVEIVSTLPYLFGLGFYSDDWDYMATLVHASGSGTTAMFRQMVQLDSHLVFRPLQLVFFVLGFKSFGINPTPYHVLMSAILGLTTVMLYIALREMRIERGLALAGALVFGLLPHYSTDRFWISSNQALVCLGFALLGIWALHRSLRAERSQILPWASLAVLAFLLSIFAYEVALGLILLAMVVFAWKTYRETGAAREKKYGRMAAIAVAGAVFVFSFLIKARMQTTIVYHHHFLTRLGEILRHAAAQAVTFNFWTYGIHLPIVVTHLIHNGAIHSASAFTALVVALAVAAYLWKCVGSFEVPSCRTVLWLMLASLMLFAAGYGLFLSNLGQDFTTPGLGNRVAIASATGAACAFVAFAILVSSFARGPRLRSRIFAVLIGVICGVNCLVISGIGFFFVDAAAQQKQIIASVTSHLYGLPHGSEVLLDGFCRYSGPAPVFEFNWDAAGALRIALQDDSLASDVISRSMKLNASSIDVTWYDFADQIPYSDHLWVYNVAHSFLAKVPTRTAMQDYLAQMNPSGNGGCPAPVEGRGVSIF